jgi:hypothetical protein
MILALDNPSDGKFRSMQARVHSLRDKSTLIGGEISAELRCEMANSQHDEAQMDVGQ